jgi:hypothetical protein
MNAIEFKNNVNSLNPTFYEKKIATVVSYFFVFKIGKTEIY